MPAVVIPVIRRDLGPSPGAMKYPTRKMRIHEITHAFRIAHSKLSMKVRHRTGGIAGAAANTKVVTALKR